MSVYVKDPRRSVDGDHYLELPWLMQWTRNQSEAWPFRDKQEAVQSCVAMGLEPSRLRFMVQRLAEEVSAR